MGEIRTRLFDSLETIEVDVDAAFDQVGRTARRRSMSRRLISGAALLVLVGLALTTALFLSGRKSHNELQSGPSPSLQEAAEVTGRVIRVSQISGSQPVGAMDGLLFELQIDNTSTDIVAGKLPGRPGATLESDGQVLLREPASEDGRSFSSYEFAKPGTKQCWKVFFPSGSIPSSVVDLKLNIPTVVPNGGPESVLAITVDPTTIIQVQADARDVACTPTL